MPENNISNFANSINREAERQKRRIEAETKRYIEGELAKAYDDARRKSHEYIGRETSKIMKASGLEISQKNIDANDMLYKRRQEICDKVFGGVLEKLGAFTSSEKYAEFLKKSAEELLKHLNGSAVFYVRPEDEIYAPLLKQVCSGCTIEIDGTINLGGLKAKEVNGKVIYNDTLDLRFEEEKESFRRYSGLSINKRDEQ